jgi:glycosyltransferase involved in cell wall biosynthesis
MTILNDTAFYRHVRMTNTNETDNNVVSVILPTYNEAGHIEQLIVEISSGLATLGVKSEIIVVDDDSPDLTWQIAGNTPVAHANVVSLRRVGERGLTSALNFGISRAIGNILVWMDADFSHPPMVILELIKPILGNRCEVAIASRYVVGGHDARDNAPELQQLLSRLLSLLSRHLLGVKVRDVSSGFIAIKKNLVPLPLKGNYGEYFLDLVTRLDRQSAVIYEVPYICTDRRSGVSKTAPTLVDLFLIGTGYLKSLLGHVCFLQRLRKIFFLS